MKTALISILTLLIGFAIGTFYGWWTGVVDGQVLATESQTWIVEYYGQHRGTNNSRSLDIAMDGLEIRLATNLAVNNNLSPMAIFIQPKADAGLLDIAACWDLDHPTGTQSLFPSDSSSAKRLDEVMSKYKGYYEATLKRQTDKRQKAQGVSQ